jgi:hypothetical protein
MVNIAKGKEILHRSGVTAVDVGDPLTTIGEVTEADAWNGETTAGKFFRPDPQINEIVVMVDITGADSTTTKYVELTPIFKSGTKIRWGEPFTLGNFQATFQGMTPLYGHDVYLKVTAISAVTEANIYIQPISST